MAKRLTTAVVEQASKRRKILEVSGDVSPLRMPGEMSRSAPLEVPIPSLPGLDAMRQRLRTLGRRAPGEKRFRDQLAKRARARRRQMKHSWRLRATRGENSVLEELSAQKKTHSAAQRRLDDFWAFVDRYRLDVQGDKGLDDASTDYADLEFLSGEGFEVGEKLLAALERWALVARQSRTVVLPRYRKALRSWRKNSPRRSRLPMPEEFMWLLTGALGAAGEVAMSLYHVSLFDTYLRPTALLWLFTDDVVSPKQGEGGTHVLIVSPVERDVATKTNTFDETVLLDGSLVPNLGELLSLQVERQEKKRAADVNAGVAEGGLPVPLWDFDARRMFLQWRGAVTLLGLPEMETLYQCRHGGASRDLLLKRRTETEIQARLHHASAGSSRIYKKPGRLLQLVNTLGPTALSYASRIRENYSKFFLAGKFPEPPVAQSRVDLS